ncbi:MAG: hydroxyacylglutathione hydrolase [Pseudomonadales bacterium]
MNVRGVPAFNDNYLWLIDNGSQAAVVDPGDAAPIMTALADNGLALAAILITHHHFDHIGGVDALLQHSLVPVFGPDDPRIPQVTVPLSNGQHCEFLGISAEVLAVPGHTSEHIAYFVADADQFGTPVLFCGDTLFAGGCGRLFEGTPAQMRSSLQKISVLPAATRVYCAHEYTQSNLRFAAAVEPGNAALQKRIIEVTHARKAGRATVPSTLADELATNPFLRWNASEVVAAAAHKKGCSAAQLDDNQVFATIRQWKDNF